MITLICTRHPIPVDINRSGVVSCLRHAYGYNLFPLYLNDIHIIIPQKIDVYLFSVIEHIPNINSQFWGISNSAYRKPLGTVLLLHIFMYTKENQAP